MSHAELRAGVIGASGYTGSELVGLLRRHPRLNLVFATSESEAGRPVAGAALRYERAECVDPASADVVFTCLPTGGGSGEWALRAGSAGAKVVDLSADLREDGSGARYGLPELWREEVAGANLVANPGCYPTGIALGLAPALRAGVVDGTRPVVIDAASGVTGAGRAPSRELLFGEVAEDYRAYGAGNRHRHVTEIGRSLERLGACPGSFVFTPHLLPVRRGILETMYVPLRSRLSAADAFDLWSAAYAEEPFVEVLAEGLPSLRRAVGRNVVAVGFAEVEAVAAPMLLVVVALDNLLKGAAGQAVQNANLLLGLDETEGLPR